MKARLFKRSDGRVIVNIPVSDYLGGHFVDDLEKPIYGELDDLEKPIYEEIADLDAPIFSWEDDLEKPLVELEDDLEKPIYEEVEDPKKPVVAEIEDLENPVIEKQPDYTQPLLKNGKIAGFKMKEVVVGYKTKRAVVSYEKKKVLVGYQKKEKSLGYEKKRVLKGYEKLNRLVGYGKIQAIVGYAQKELTLADCPIPEELKGLEYTVVDIQDLPASACPTQLYFDGPCKKENLHYDQDWERGLMQVQSIKAKHIQRLSKKLDEELAKPNPDTIAVAKLNRQIEIFKTRCACNPTDCKCANGLRVYQQALENLSEDVKNGRKDKPKIRKLLKEKIDSLLELQSQGAKQ